MPSRRSLLIGATGALLSGVAASACSNRRDAAPASTSTTSTPPSSAPSTTSSPSTSAPSTSNPSTSAPTPVSNTTSVPTAGAWTGADFGELDAFVESTNANGFAIVEGGTLIHEWYRNDPAQRRDIASAQKSVLSLLVGRAIADGHFAIDTTIDEILGNGWTSHGNTSTITIRHLLTMTSGLDDQLELVAAPDTLWLYSGAFAQLFEVLTAATGRELNDLANDWLFAPAGADTAVFYERRTNQFAPIGLFAAISDLAAIGNWVLDQPDSEWLRTSFSADQSLNEAYGSLWWLNGKSSFVLPGPRERVQQGALIPSAPADLVAALGRDDQKLYLSPSLSLAVARLGDRAAPRTSQALSSFDNELWALLTRLRG